MSKLPDRSALGRRAFLLGSSLTAAGLAGCVEIGSEEGATAGGETGSGGGDEDDEEGDDESESSGPPTAPDPDFVVGTSDEADYETLQEAYDALESGDVIGLEPGEYRLQPEVENADIGEGENLLKTYTYVGQSPEETSIRFEKPEARSFIVRGPQRFLPGDGPPGFWHLTLDVPEDVTFSRSDAYADRDALEEYDDDLVIEYDDEVLDAYEDAQIDAHYCVINGSLDGPTVAYDTTFNDEINHRVAPTECRFHGPVRGGRVAARRCQFNDRLDSDGGYVLDSTIEGVASLNHVTMRRCELQRGLNVTGHGAVDDCVVDPKPDETTAIDIKSEYDVAVTDSEIRGTVRSNQDGSFVSRFEGNTFEVPSGTGYVIDGAPATEIYLNAFLGGDVRITTDTGDLSTFPADELTLYDPERELGNYYGEWDLVDRADEGTLEARTLPGEDGEMDRYPLAHPDVQAYAEAAEAEEDEDEDD